MISENLKMLCRSKYAKTFAKAEATVFVLATTVATYSAARIDAGSWTNPDPLREVGHYMTLGEAVIYNIPIGIAEGLLAVFMVAVFTFAAALI